MGTYALIGVVAGLIVSSWQGFKDPPWEGFSPVKFARSPCVGGAVGVVAFWLEMNTNVMRVDNLGALLVAVLGTIGFERCAVEFYKTFLTRQVRGIHAPSVPTYPHWFKKRWVFFASYAVSIGVFIVLLT